MKKILQKILLVAFLFILFQLITQPVLAEGKTVFLDYFYNEGCGSCTKYIEEGPPAGAIWTINQTYNDTVTIRLKQYNDPAYKEEYKTYIQKYSSIISVYPFVVIKASSNETVLPKINITVDDMQNVIDAYLAEMEPNITINKDVIAIDFLFWHFRFDASGLSFSVLAIVLAGVDSFNPCVFFILIFLLNLLIYAKSRRRMLLIGGVFVFFSAFIYFIFMVLLLHAFQLTLEVGITAIAVGVIALILGSINIKEFFFFKKGVSLSIPEGKKPQIYKRMRELLKTPQILWVLIGTIALAIMVNFYELLCSIGLPAEYTSKLALSNLPDAQIYFYILFYNIIYVIPMIVIVLIFVITLGKRKLSEWHGRILKLLSGVMMASFGILFLVSFKLLENVVTPVLLLVFSLLATFVISYIWKKYKDKKEAM
jgi:hypothetical protein